MKWSVHLDVHTVQRSMTTTSMRGSLRLAQNMHKKKQTTAAQHLINSSIYAEFNMSCHSYYMPYSLLCSFLELASLVLMVSSYIFWESYYHLLVVQTLTIYIVYPAKAAIQMCMGFRFYDEVQHWKLFLPLEYASDEGRYPFRDGLLASSLSLPQVPQGQLRNKPTSPLKMLIVISALQCL